MSPTQRQCVFPMTDWVMTSIRIKKPSEMNWVSKVWQGTISVSLVTKEIPEPLDAQRRIALGVPDVYMPEVVLNAAGILAVVDQLVATGMAQHVRVHGEAYPGPFARSGDQLPYRGRGERTATFAQEEVGGIRPVALQFA